MIATIPVRVPLKPTRSRPDPKPTPANATSGSPRVLIVEDEMLIAEYVRVALESANYQVVGPANCLWDAIALTRQHRPDVALMDVRLRDGDCGIETAKFLREHYQLAVVFLTAFSDPALLRQAKAADPFGYLIKPFDERELCATVEMALHKNQGERRAREEALPAHGR